MEMATNTMADKLPDNRKTVLFHMFLHSFGYVVYAIPGNCLGNPSIKGLPRHFQQKKPFRNNLPDRNANSGITVIAFILNAKIYTDYVTIPDYDLLGWNPVYHLFIDGNTQTTRETTISFKSRFGPTITTIFFCQCIQKYGCAANLNSLGKQSQSLGNDPISLQQ